MKVLIIQKGVFKKMAAKFSRFSELYFLLVKTWSIASSGVRLINFRLYTLLRMN